MKPKLGEFWAVLKIPQVKRQFFATYILNLNVIGRVSKKLWLSILVLTPSTQYYIS